MGSQYEELTLWALRDGEIDLAQPQKERASVFIGRSSVMNVSIENDKQFGAHRTASIDLTQRPRAHKKGGPPTRTSSMPLRTGDRPVRAINPTRAEWFLKLSGTHDQPFGLAEYSQKHPRNSPAIIVRSCFHHPIHRRMLAVLDLDPKLRPTDVRNSGRLFPVRRCRASRQKNTRRGGGCSDSGPSLREVRE